MGKMSVLLTTEGTYPYYTGGVSTWCHQLITNLNQIEYILLSVIDSPLAVQRYRLPGNVKEFITIPLWGTVEPSEHLNWILFSSIFMSKLSTNETIVEKEFLPIFSEVVEEIISVEKNPKRFGENLLKMYKYFKKYDYYKTLKSKKVYEFYVEKILRNLGNNDYFFGRDSLIPTFYELGESLGWFFRFFNITNTYVPITDITHSSAAGFCGIPNVISKLLYKTPYLLTEHGIYLREQYLSPYRRKMPYFLRNFFSSLVESVVRLNYEYADMVCPVCHYNSRWEKRLGVPHTKIKVLYNGVDPKVFEPKGLKDNKTIVAVARIDPLKDIENFIYAAYLILKTIPDVNFEVYGAISDKEYYKECLKLRDSLGLKGKLEFKGHIEPGEVYHKGDIIVLSSISEAFPYSVIEAMMCGKPIIATDVGGVSEALGSCGIVVSPRNSKELADGCITLLNDKDLRKELGKRSYERAKNLFNIENFTHAYLKVYEELIFRS